MPHDRPRRSPPVALTIAGSDCCAGAGLQADLKTFASCGCHGLTAVTCVVSEVPGRVEAIQAVRPGLVEGQVRLLLESYPVAAVKTGMLFSPAILRAAARALDVYDGPVVVDPVMVASSGDPLLQPQAVELYRQRLFPRATVVTPNLDELSLLAGCKVKSLRQMRDWGLALAEEYGCAFLLKGGHLGGREATDLLVSGGQVEELKAEFIRGVSTHGTGCTYSAAIAAHLARGFPLEESVRRSKIFITQAIRNSLRWGRVEALAITPFKD